MRDEVMMDPVDRAMDDPEFKKKVREDLERTLSEYGYGLTHEEMEAVKEFEQQTAGITDEEVDRALIQNAGGGQAAHGSIGNNSPSRRQFG